MDTFKYSEVHIEQQDRNGEKEINRTITSKTRIYHALSKASLERKRTSKRIHGSDSCLLKKQTNYNTGNVYEILIEDVKCDNEKN